MCAMVTDSPKILVLLFSHGLPTFLIDSSGLGLPPSSDGFVPGDARHFIASYDWQMTSGVGEFGLRVAMAQSRTVVPPLCRNGQYKRAR